MTATIESEMPIEGQANRAFRRKFNAVLMSAKKAGRKALSKEQLKKAFGFPPAQEGYVSRTMVGMCKNLDCNGMRRDGSAYCQKCSDKFKK